MQLSHTHPVRSAVFDDPSLVSSAGLVPMLALARSAGLTKLADQHLSVPTDKGANPGLKVSSLVAGMVAGADSTKDTAPVIVAQRLRKGSCGSPRGAKRLVTDALATVRKLRTGPGAGKVLLRADSAFYGHGPVGAAVRAGAQVSVTVRLDPTVKALSLIHISEPTRPY